MHASEERAFNHGLRFGSDFTPVGELVGDAELPSDCYERLLAKLRDGPLLGIASAVLAERSAGVWKVQRVRGALKLYSHDCFGAIGGVCEMLGWDGIDDVLARIRMSGHLRSGRSTYIEGYPPSWSTARSVKAATSRPYIAPGLAYFAGYLHAAVRRAPRFETEGYRPQLSGELRTRATDKLKRFAPV